MTNPKVRKPAAIQQLNSWRMHRQFLARPFSGDLVELIKSVGWIYSPGCSTPYLSCWARMQSFKTKDLDRLVFEDRKLVQLETLRGCTMLVPRDQAAVALRIRPRTFTELAKQARPQMSITDGEMETLKNAILKALETGAQTTEQLCKTVPRALVRDFGPDLKRIGFTNSLALAINLLKEEARIIKIQTRSRLDSTEYSYVLLSDVLPEVDPFSMRTEEAAARLAEQYFRAEGPARVKDFAWWAGINVTDAIRAAEEVRPRLTAIMVEGSKDEYLIGEKDLDRFNEFMAATPAGTAATAAARDQAVNLIPYRDTYLKGQRAIVDRFLRDEHGDKPFSRWKGKLINDPLATIIVNGQVAGVWEWNEADGSVDYLAFEEPSRALDKSIRNRARELSGFVREGLGGIRQGLNYGPYQMTGIHDLKAFWGKGVQVDVHA